MELIGTYSNESKTILITFKPGRVYSLSGLSGFNTDSGTYWFEESEVAGYAYSLALKPSEKLEDIFSKATYKMPIKLINSNSFAVLGDYFCKRDFYDVLQPTVFAKLV